MRGYLSVVGGHISARVVRGAVCDRGYGFGFELVVFPVTSGWMCLVVGGINIFHVSAVEYWVCIYRQSVAGVAKNFRQLGVTFRE